MPQLRIITYNIEGRHADRRQLLALMRQHTPDLVMLQEVPRERLAQWFGTQLQLPYQHFATYNGIRQGGVAILSRWPLGSPHILHFQHSKQGRVTLATQVYTPAGTVWAGSVHLNAPRRGEFGTSFLQQAAFVWKEFFTASQRYRQAQELRAWLAALTTGDCILGGDFNSMPLSSADRYISSKYFDDALRQRPWRYFSGTFWDLPQAPITPRIDYVYHTSRFRVVEARVIQKKLSDHYPVLAILAPPASSALNLEAILQEQAGVSVAQSSGRRRLSGAALCCGSALIGFVAGGLRERDQITPRVLHDTLTHLCRESPPA